MNPMPPPQPEKPRPATRRFGVHLQAALAFALVGFLLVAVPCMGMVAGKDRWWVVLGVAAVYGLLGAGVGFGVGFCVGEFVAGLLDEYPRNRRG